MTDIEIERVELIWSVDNIDKQSGTLDRALLVLATRAERLSDRLEKTVQKGTLSAKDAEAIKDKTAHVYHLLDTCNDVCDKLKEYVNDISTLGDTAKS